jgi:3,4-dihydroxy 2-butanone 4-phosphate synthase/GTP cyclohydrolase II
MLRVNFSGATSYTMKLADYLSENSIRPSHFAARIGVSPQTITGWCKGTFWIKRDQAQRVFKETSGAVTPNDFMNVDEVV